MTKFPGKRYLLAIFLLCAVFISVPLSASNVPDSSTVLNESYNSLINIQKQLKAITKNAYINAVSNTPNDNSVKQLSIFTDQINKIHSDLSDLVPLSLSKSESEKLQSLLTISSYLKYIQEKMNTLLLSNDAYEQYDAFSAIFVANALIDQLLLYTSPN